MNTDKHIDVSKSKVTREAIGLLLFSLYPAIKGGERIALARKIKLAEMPSAQIILALKECKVLENTGGSSYAAEWRWLPASPPNDMMIERVYNNYAAQLQEYRKRMIDKADKRNGINRQESGPAVKVSKGGDSNPSLYIQERLQLIEEKQRYQVDLLVTLCKNLGLTETIGGFKIE